MSYYTWQETFTVESHSYTCGYCRKLVASNTGWSAVYRPHRLSERGVIYLCPKCDRPTFVSDDGRHWPGSPFGEEVEDVPEEAITKLYNEARYCIGVGSYTAAVLCCRKLLMHIAVSKGAQSGLNFVDYIQYLSDNHFIPPDAKGWVDHIRKKGNEANHEIIIMPEEDARELVTFLGILMKVIFEFPARINRKISAPKPKPLGTPRPS